MWWLRYAHLTLPLQNHYWCLLWTSSDVIWHFLGIHFKVFVSIPCLPFLAGEKKKHLALEGAQYWRPKVRFLPPSKISSWTRVWILEVFICLVGFHAFVLAFFQFCISGHIFRSLNIVTNSKCRLPFWQFGPTSTEFPHSFPLKVILKSS